MNSEGLYRANPDEIDTVNILLAVDNTPHSKVAVDVLLNRLWPDGSEFKVFCAIERRDPIFAVMQPKEKKDIQEKALAAAQEFTTEVARKIEESFPKCTASGEAQFGSGKELIVANSSWPADLIVMGSRGRQGIPRIVLGSVSQTVLLHGQCSTLIARYQQAHEGTPIFDRNILIAVDNSEHSRHAMDWVLKLPWHDDTKFNLISILPLMVDNFTNGIDALHTRGVTNAREEQMQMTKEFLKKSLSRFQHAFGSNRVTGEFTEGNPGETILNKARKWPAGLIVLGSRAHGPMKRVIMGSVSQEVVLQAPCPVEVVKFVPKQE